MGDGLKGARAAATGPTPAQLEALKDAAKVGSGRIYLYGSGKQQMLQRMAASGWGEHSAGIFTINDTGRRLAREG